MRYTHLNRLVAVVVVIGLALPLALTVSSAPEARAALGALDSAKIDELIYPTFGNPAIVRVGSTFTVEFDPRKGAYWGQKLPTLTAFEVRATSTNDKYPATKKLTVRSFEPGHSTRWPELAATEEPDNRVYLVEVTVPYDVPYDLFDLTVRGKKSNGTWMTDSQPHAFKAVEEYKERFSFCQLSDIHVFGPELTYPGSNQKERSARRTTWDAGVGYGATYYHKAIGQLNRMNPDFLIFTGDYMFGQKYFTKDQGSPWGTTTEYEYEMLWFYTESMKLDVPVFMVMGNHDGYVDHNEDWLTCWRELFGPLYYSFDYGDCHFLSLCSMDWTSALRTLTDYLGIILQPTKYKGQFRGGGDNWKSGATESQFAAVHETNFTGQLAWARDDLKAHQDSKMLVVAMHHDPWKSDGSGSMWASGTDPYIGSYLDMGNGQGRIAIMKLMRDYKVSLAVSGHDHSDYIGSIGWTGGGGEVKFVNTTSTSFQADGNSTEYPGYRRIWIDSGAVTSHSYINPKYSYPFYDGCTIPGTTDLHTLSTPAIQSTWSPADPGDSTSVTCTVSNHLDRSVPDAYGEFPMPYLSGGYYYKVSGGEFGSVYDTSTDKRVCQVYGDVGQNASKALRVYKSSSPDKTRPSGSFKINNGAANTTSRSVSLKVSASDSGGSGVKDMMISNRSDFGGAYWEPVRSSRSWQLESGESGKRTVYMKFRDMAMPPNVSGIVEQEIVYSPGEDPGGPQKTWYFAEGCTRDGFEEWLCIQNPNDRVCDVDVTYMLETGENVPQSVTIEPKSRCTIFVNDAVGAGQDVAATVSASLPVLAERPMYFDYQGMWDGGHDVIGTNSARNRWYFAEGCTREYPDANFHTWLCMLNPHESEVSVDITYMLESGENRAQELKIPAKSRKTVCVNREIGPGQDVSTAVEASDTIICERPIYFSYGGGWTDGHDVIGAVGPANDWYLAEGTTHGGFKTYICIQNPGDKDANVTLDFMLQEGEVPEQSMVVPAKSRRTVCVNDMVGEAKNVSTHVRSDQPVITERPMYFSYGPAGWNGGSCVVGATGRHQKWYFAEGCTRAGFDEWLSIQNPTGEDGKVTVTYMLEDGTNQEADVSVPKTSRTTIDVRSHIAQEHDVSAVIESTVPVIIERPMYFDYHGSWTGGHCVVGSGDD